MDKASFRSHVTGTSGAPPRHQHFDIMRLLRLNGPEFVRAENAELGVCAVDQFSAAQAPDLKLDLSG